MKNLKTAIPLLLIVIFLSSCGTSVKVADQWKNKNLASLKNEKVLVIHKTPNEVSKKRFEQDLVKELKAIGIDAVEAYRAFPDVKYRESITPEQTQAIIDKLKSAGYNGVILTVLKDKNQQIETTSSGGYYSGGFYPSYYGRYYGGFGSYYSGVYGYGYGGSYIPPSSTTKTVSIYLMETVSYNLSLKDGEQLVGAVSVKISDPQSYTGVAGKYIKIVLDQFKD